jgi:glycosyltransferase A (GT-A) superfamily protein (DUF2064 family)
LEGLNAHTAILLFTRTSCEEAQVKKFTQSKGRNKAITTQLIDRTKHLVRQAGLSLIVVSSTKQKGQTFGERLKDAIQQVFDAGYDKVICLGNDSPGLTPALLRSAAAKLQQQDFVFGEAVDGGVYLMGMHRSTIPKLDFAAIPWRTSLVFKALCSQAAFARLAVLGPILQDADDAVSILAMSRKWCFCSFSKVLQSLLSLLQPGIIRFAPLLSSATTATHGLRAPPAS